MSNPSHEPSPFDTSYATFIQPETLRIVGDDLQRETPTEREEQFRRLVRLNPALGALTLVYAQAIEDNKGPAASTAFVDGVQFMLRAIEATRQNILLEAMLRDDPIPKNPTDVQ